jgi:hypothetical protein
MFAIMNGLVFKIKTYGIELASLTLETLTMVISLLTSIDFSKYIVWLWLALIYLLHIIIYCVYYSVEDKHIFC